MRDITSHQVPGNDLNMQLNVQALDDPGPGGANHHYLITSYGIDAGFDGTSEIKFQNGPLKEAGLNGVSNEAILAVLIDRMQGFQRGQFSCRENAVVLTHLETAQLWLAKRTLDRMARGVEGTMAK